jgi:hypothetical protein
MSLLNPWVIIALICAFLGVGGVGYSKGKTHEYERQQIEIAVLNAKARETENRMGEVAQTYAQTLRKSNDVAKAKESKLRNDIVNSKLRLFVPVQAPECAIPATADAPAPAGDTETRAELDPRIAESLVDLTSRGDQAIRSLNACIDQYNEMRSFK